MTRIVFVDPARDEMIEAAEYYENQSTGLGKDFIAEVQHTVNRIVENPKSGRIIRSNIRRRLLRRFPYGILYRTDAEKIVIVAVMHLRRRPGYWRYRI
ncbi:MAG: type II toxin-antitoxin system RelE/ParE family toxin [Planctomycetes bacterium]|nr:type II toxin-antitoxin system RelE/ParE family toxin [Planctomycetota bacterium]